MVESLLVPSSEDRAEIYAAVIPQVEALLAGEKDLIANMANIAGALKQAFGFFWVGFYRAIEGELVLGPFQGPIACTRIAFTRGVCGHCYTTRKAVIVPDVEKFAGHIACSSDARSEIVVPIFGKNGEVIAVLDVDSDRLADFSEADERGLLRICELLT